MKKKGRFQYAKQKKFGGKQFRFQGSSESKAGAQRAAKILRDSGKRVRVTKHYSVWLIYAR